jgi:hypothetical protein
MKNLLPVLFVLCAFASCKQKPAATAESPAAGTTPDTSALITPGPDAIPYELASRMVKYYEPHVGTLQRPNGTIVPGEGNTRSVWFDLDKLDKFVQMLKKERADNGKTDGVRVYFSTYGDNTKEPLAYKLDPSYSFRNTLVFVSTKDSVANETTGQVHYHQDYFKNEKAFTFTDPADKGELCPPPSPCCKLGALLSCPQ